MADFLDNFSGTGFLGNHLSDSGHAWSVGAGSNNWSLNGSGLLNFTTTPNSIMVTDPGLPNYALTLQFNAWNGNDQLILRYTDNNNYMYLTKTTDSKLWVMTKIAGSLAVVTSWSVPIGSGVALKIVVTGKGSNYTFHVESDYFATFDTTFTVSNFSSATKVGFMSSNAGSVLNSMSAVNPITPTELAGSAPMTVVTSGALQSALINYLGLAGQADLTAGGQATISTAISFDAVLDLDLTVLDPVVYSGAQDAGNGPRPDVPDRLELSMSFAVRFALDYPLAPSLAGGTALTRGMLGIAAGIETPTVVQGRPVMSPLWGIEDSVSSVSGIQIIPEPDPPPLPPKKPSDPDPVQYRWLSKDQPLNDQWIESWPAHGGGPAWKSLFPFRPKLKAHIHYGAKGKKYIHSNAVFFNPSYVEHMWLDMGHALVQPYTWMFAVIILGYPAGDYRQYLLDAGKAQKTSTISRVRKGYNISDGLSYRNTLIADRKQLIVGTKNGAGVARAPHHYAARPRVFAGVYNGSNSYAAVMDEKSAKIVKGSVPVTKPRYFVSGRKQGRIDTDDAAHFMIFEIRLIEHAALSPTELRKHYKQLASKYKFNSY